MSEGIEPLCGHHSCTSLRRELATIFGTPTVRSDETWNAAMLKLIADTLADMETAYELARNGSSGNLRNERANQNAETFKRMVNGE